MIRKKELLAECENRKSGVKISWTHKKPVNFLFDAEKRKKKDLEKSSFGLVKTSIKSLRQLATQFELLL